MDIAARVRLASISKANRIYNSIISMTDIYESDKKIVEQKIKELTVQYAAIQTVRKLSVEEINHYQKIVIALTDTLRLMQEIDKIIPGFPIE